MDIHDNLLQKEFASKQAQIKNQLENRKCDLIQVFFSLCRLLYIITMQDRRTDSQKGQIYGWMDG